MIVQICAALGGIALFLYGMELMGEGLQKAAGDRLQQILAKLTSKVTMGVVLGALVTALLQSSTATTVMTVGLVNAGLMTLRQAFGIVMGANVGTTITAQLIAFNLSDYITGILFVGFVVMTFAKRKHMRFIGQVLLGFGLLMLGVDLLTQAAVPLRNYPGVVELISKFSDIPAFGVVAGIIMVVIIQSSAACVGILMAMATQGILPLEGVIPVLLGNNIGTCLTAILAASRGNGAAKKVSLSHVLFNLIGCIIAVLFMPWFIDLVHFISPPGDIARQVANAHSAFNVLTTLIFMPFAGVFIDTIERLVPDKGEVIVNRAMYLDDNMLGTPTLAMSLAIKEVVRMGETARTNMNAALRCLHEFNEADYQYVREHEPVVDKLEEDITIYLTKISETQLSPELAPRHAGLLHAINDIERMGDHADTIVKRLRTMQEDDVHFSESAQAELEQLGAMVMEATGMALQALEKNDKQLASETWTRCREVKQFAKQMRKNHVYRLNLGQCTPQAGFIQLELLINLKRTSDHAKNISQLVLGIF